MPKTPGGMGGLSDEAAAETNKVLEDREAEMLATTVIDWNRLRPKVADKDLYDKLAAAVQIATAQNEGIAGVKARIQALGIAGIALARKVVGLLA